MGRLRRIAGVLARFCIAAFLCFSGTAASAQDAPSSPFSDWAAVVVAGDWHAHSGKPSEAFDNARHDVSQALLRIGFKPENLLQFSVRPERYKDAWVGQSNPDVIFNSLTTVAAHATGGCLLYFSSHGAPEGLVIDQDILPPDGMAQIVDGACGTRPTVVVISACFSGVFIPQLEQKNRMVFTAARPDRTSFGCGQDDRYPYFDDCFLSSIPGAHDFTALAHLVKACVAAREIKEGMSPPSEPQLSIGPQLAPFLPLLAFATAPP